MDLIGIRKALHQIPEMAFEEQETSSYILEILTSMSDLKIHKFNKSHAILAEYSFGSGGYTLFRADMDALPVVEESGCEFPSNKIGMMHACGHDVHMTVLLGLIDQVISMHPQKNLLFLFQPAEEGKGGAESVLSEGILQEYEILEAIALHVASGMPVGTVSSRSGIFFGIPQEFDVKFQGKASHAAYPEKGINALNSGLLFLSLMNTDIDDLSREHRVIFHVGKMEAGTIRNIVPDLCVIEGTHRSLEKDCRDKMNQFIKDNALLAASQTGAQHSYDLLCSYDPVVNNESLVNRLEMYTSELDLNYVQADPAMTGEDFGFFTSLYPGLLFWLGSGCDAPLHSGKFLPDSGCISIGVQILYKFIE